jgi:hypothetical protein
MMPKARTDKLSVRQLVEETVIYDLESHKAHSLNAAAAFVWRHCDGLTSIAELARLLHAELKLPDSEELVRLASAGPAGAPAFAGGRNPDGPAAAGAPLAPRCSEEAGRCRDRSACHHDHHEAKSLGVNHGWSLGELPTWYDAMHEHTRHHW